MRQWHYIIYTNFFESYFSSNALITHHTSTASTYSNYTEPPATSLYIMHHLYWLHQIIHCKQSPHYTPLVISINSILPHTTSSYLITHHSSSLSTPFLPHTTSSYFITHHSSLSTPFYHIPPVVTSLHTTHHLYQLHSIIHHTSPLSTPFHRTPHIICVNSFLLHTASSYLITHHTSFLSTPFNYTPHFICINSILSRTDSSHPLTHHT